MLRPDDVHRTTPYSLPDWDGSMALGSWVEDALLGRTRPAAWVPSRRAAAARTTAVAVLILRALCDNDASDFAGGGARLPSRTATSKGDVAHAL